MVIVYYTCLGLKAINKKKQLLSKVSGFRFKPDFLHPWKSKNAIINKNTSAVRNRQPYRFEALSKITADFTVSQKC